MEASHSQFWAVEEGSKNSQKVPEKRRESAALREQRKGLQGEIGPGVPRC